MAKMQVKTRAMQDTEAAKATEEAATEARLAPKPMTKKGPNDLGFLSREAAHPSSELHSQIQKQIGHATSITKNPSHGLALRQISEELSARIAHTGSGNTPSANADLEESNQHIDNANQSIDAHQQAHGAGNAPAAVFHLGEAGRHLATAVSSLPTGQRAILKDDWKPQGTPWKVPAAENAHEHSEHVSLENVQKNINSTVQSYHKQVSKKVASAGPVPEDVTPTTNIPLSRELHHTYMPLESVRTQSHRFDQGAGALNARESLRTEQQTRDADSDQRDDRRFRAEQRKTTPTVNLGDHFDVGIAGGRG